MKKRLRVLDLFCGAGGAGAGYFLAGCDVVGVDIVAQPHYPFRFYKADAVGFPLDSFDVVHASPPCQRWMRVPKARREHYPDLLTPTRERLKAWGGDWVIENLATAPLDGPVFCGSSFGLPIIRHRRFETSFELGLIPNACRATSWERSTGHGPDFVPYAHGSWRPRWRSEVLPVVWPWMTLEESQEAIPPAYTRFIGEQLMREVE